MKILHNLLKKYKNWKPYKSCEEMPTFLLVFFVIPTGIAYSYYNHVIKEALYSLYDALNKTPIGEWPWGYLLLLSFAIGMMALFAWISAGSIASNCKKALLKRWKLDR